jgi:hypothetical protein
MTRITTLKPTNPLIWAVVALSVAGGFFYANHSTTAARFGAKPTVVESTSALEHIPAVTGADSSAALQW